MEIALIFLIVFSAFGWFVYRAYRFIAFNSGHLSPEFHRVTWKISFRRYFTRLPAVSITMMGLLNLVLWNLFFFGPPLPDWRSFGAMLLMLLVFSGMVFLMGSLEWQSWTLTAGVAVTFDPADGSMEVEWMGRSVRITPENVIRFDVHEGADTPRLMSGYGYFDAYLTDGQVVRLNGIFMDYHEFMRKHYLHVPTQVTKYRLPWKMAAEVIRDIEPT